VPKPKIMISDIVTAFDAEAIGTKVCDHETFTAELLRIVEGHTFPTKDNPETREVAGQAFIPTPTLVPFVSSGDAPRPGSVPDSLAYRFVKELADPEGPYAQATAGDMRADAAQVKVQSEGLAPQEKEGYLTREYRGETHSFLVRTEDQPAPSFCALVVYTIDAYLRDPDITETPDRLEEASLAKSDGVTHVLVAVLGSCGPKPTRSPFRYVSNLAGGNLEQTQATAKAIREEAAEIIAYTDAWATVAD
jgi:hypothetical protein